MELGQNSEIEKAISQHLATGRYATAEEVVLTALQRLDEDDAEYRATLESLQESLADFEAGRMKPASEVFEKIRGKHGFREPEKA